MSEKKKFNTQIMFLIISIVLLFEGIMLILYPAEALLYILIIPAVALLAYGIIAVIVYKNKKNREDITKKTYVFPVISIICGALLLIFNKEAGFLLPFAIGAWIIVSAFIMLKKSGEILGGKACMRICAVIALASGAALVVIGFTGSIYFQTVLVGSMFALYGIVNIVYQIAYAAHNKNQPRVK